MLDKSIADQTAAFLGQDTSSEEDDNVATIPLIEDDNQAAAGASGQVGLVVEAQVQDVDAEDDEGEDGEGEEEADEEGEQEEEFMRICEFVPNNFAINTIVRLHKINAVVTQFHNQTAEFGPITPTQQNLI